MPDALPRSSPTVIDSDAVTLAGLLFETSAGLQTRVDSQLRAESGLPIASFEVLIRVLRSPDGRVGLSELGRELAITTGGITRLIDRLEAQKLVRRVRDRNDRRHVHATLTARGRATVLRALPGHIEDLNDLIDGALTPRQRGNLAAALRSLRAALLVS